MIVPGPANGEGAEKSFHQKQSMQDNVEVGKPGKRHEIPWRSLEEISQDDFDVLDTVCTEEAVQFAEAENRIRQGVIELIHPTVQRSVHLEKKVKMLQAEVEKHTAFLIDIPQSKVDIHQHGKMLDSFREVMTKWEYKTLSSEGNVVEQLSLARLELDAVRMQMQQQHATTMSLQRIVDRVVSDLTAVHDSFDELRQDTNGNLAKQRQRLGDFTDDFATQLIEVQSKMNRLSDAVQDESTSLLRLASELRLNDKQAVKLCEQVSLLNVEKVDVSEFRTTHESMTQMIKQAEQSMHLLKRTLDGMLTHVKENFNVAIETVATQSHDMLKELRKSCERSSARCEELAKEIETISSRDDTPEAGGYVQLFGLASGRKVVNPPKRRVSSGGVDRVDVVDETQILQEVGMKSIIDLRKDFEAHKANVAHESKMATIERKNTKSIIGRVEESVKGLESKVDSISGVLWMMVQSERAAAALGVQDDLDRQKVALVGYRDVAPSDQVFAPSPASTRPSTRGTNASPLPSICGVLGREKATPRGGSWQDEVITARGIHSREKAAPLGADCQDELISGPVMSVDQRCLSCSGNRNLVLAGFKMACLQYAPGPVQFAKKTWPRSELLSLRMKLLSQAFAALESGETIDDRSDPFIMTKATTEASSFTTMPTEVARDQILRAALQQTR